MYVVQQCSTWWCCRCTILTIHASPQGTWRPCGATWHLCIRWPGQLTAGCWSAAAAIALWKFGTSRLGSSTSTYQVTLTRWGAHRRYFLMFPVAEKMTISNLSVARTGVRSGLESRWAESGEWREGQMSTNVSKMQGLATIPRACFLALKPCDLSADGDDSRPVSQL